ncbi:adaptor complex medium subunit family-domain containing protein [Nitzschia inconspicua]|uniref:Adaptor complex medium subunit family-domain containing protein n=1 Tax=Nitzschia inconspicua TaxID=303405 RepID=A0A9K3KKX9_9STRA|nr:adaptor complex medium subunit family-domain containing protein [Nitzschia inconspicua]
MIQSLFILSPTGEVLIERHFRGVTSRSVCDFFWDKASVGVNHHGGLSTTTSLLTNEEQQLLLPLDVLPVMEVPESKHGTVYIISILRDGLSYLAVLPAEVSPLMVLEFLHRIADIFVDYFGNPADESAIKDNFSTVYQLLEEMVDYGWPLTTEPNALKAMIRPPTVISKLSSVVGFSNTANVSDALPSGTISNMPWRAAGVSYSQNEIYMDIVEEVDAIVDTTGNVISLDVSGSIQCQCHLSGIPDLLLTFKDPNLIDDCSFHPCVRYGRFERDQVISFVPPDGNFELMKYSIGADKRSHFSPPLDCHFQWNVTKPAADGSDTADYSARLLVEVRVKSLSSLITSASRNSSIRMMVEDVAVTIPFPKQVRTASFQVSPGTSVIFDEAGKVAKWTLGKLADDASMPRAQLTANLKLNPPKQHYSTNKDNYDAKYNDDDQNEQDIQPPNLSLHWKIPLTSVSGLTVSGLSIAGENYRPYKGVRNVTKSGIFQVRYS